MRLPIGAADPLQRQPRPNYRDARPFSGRNTSHNNQQRMSSLWHNHPIPMSKQNPTANRSRQHMMVKAGPMEPAAGC